MLNNNTIVTTVMSNLGLYKALDKAGISYEKTAVGDKYVNENMTKYGHSLGGEQSGHIIFSKFATTGDGVLTSLKIMEAMLEQKQPLSKLVEPVTIFPQLLENVRVKDKAAAQADPDVIKAVKAVEEALGDNGRILVRQSGTEPLVRVMVEAETDEICQKYVKQVVDVLVANGHLAEQA
jgi:phosphoglucosamine mutase